MKTLIAIDPGVDTGYAVKRGGVLVLVSSAAAIDVENYVLSRSAIEEIELIIEDSRKNKWIGPRGWKRALGVGGVWRDCSRWEEFCLYNKIKHDLVPVNYRITKYKKEKFKKITGYLGRTNSHGRDAGMLLHGK